MRFLVYMYYTHLGYQTSIFGKNCAYYIRIFTGKLVWTSLWCCSQWNNDARCTRKFSFYNFWIFLKLMWHKCTISFIANIRADGISTVSWWQATVVYNSSYTSYNLSSVSQCCHNQLFHLTNLADYWSKQRTHSHNMQPSLCTLTSTSFRIEDQVQGLACMLLRCQRQERWHCILNEDLKDFSRTSTDSFVFIKPQFNLILIKFRNLIFTAIHIHRRYQCISTRYIPGLRFLTPCNRTRLECYITVT